MWCACLFKSPLWISGPFPPVNVTPQRRLNVLRHAACRTNLGLGGVVLLDDGPLVSVQAVAHLEPLHEDVPVAVLPALDHHAAHHLVLAQIHLPGRRTRGKQHSSWFDCTVNTLDCYFVTSTDDQLLLLSYFFNWRSTSVTSLLQLKINFCYLVTSSTDDQLLLLSYFNWRSTSVT